MLGAITTNYLVVEDGKEIQTVASLLGAAMLWAENRARRVYQVALSSPPGPDAWQRGREVTADELRAALTVRLGTRGLASAEKPRKGWRAARLLGRSRNRTPDSIKEIAHDRPMEAATYNGRRKLILEDRNDALGVRHSQLIHAQAVCLAPLIPLKFRWRVAVLLERKSH